MPHWSENLDLSGIKTPCFVIDESTLEKDGQILEDIQKRARCKILLALKAYRVKETFPIISKYLAGVCAGSYHEARLGKEFFKKEVHTYLPAVIPEEFPEIVNCSDYIIFNNLADFLKYASDAKNKKLGLRINPEKDVLSDKMGHYAPCRPGSRLGVTLSQLEGKSLEGITGLHFHALCEQGFEEFQQVLAAFENRFSPYIKQMSWINFGGGHHFTKDRYDREGLIKTVLEFRERFPNIQDIYFEPGEAVVWDAGVFVSSVRSIVENVKKTAMLDMSVEAHNPDVLHTRHEPEPYIPEVLGAKIISKEEDKVEGEHLYTLGGISCAAGDIVADYSFQNPLEAGKKLVFLDTAYYSMAKLSYFCGVPMPSIAIRNKQGKIDVVREYTHKDFERFS